MLEAFLKLNHKKMTQENHACPLIERLSKCSSRGLITKKYLSTWLKNNGSLTGRPYRVRLQINVMRLSTTINLLIDAREPRSVGATQPGVIDIKESCSVCASVSQSARPPLEPSARNPHFSSLFS